jgi:hypothetical protein
MERSTSPYTADNCGFLRQSVDPPVNTWCSYVLGHEAMKRMGSSNVLIVGLKGLGVEIGMQPRRCVHRPFKEIC